MEKPQKTARLPSFILMLTAILLGLFCGAGYAYMSTGSFSGFSGKDRLQLGPWSTDLTIGSTATDAKTRAMVARRGILALPQSEAIYFTAFKDSEGRALEERCSYVLDMSELDFAEWWSVTVYNKDGFLPNGGQDWWSVTSSQYEEGDAQTLMLVPSAQFRMREGLGISLAGTEEPNLLIRFYKPDLKLVKNLTDNDLPDIERLNCGRPEL